ncbi:MAG: DEAD/DEAH box helicase [Myxococcota bacterium]|nr:DEAD/DEAH box helicase [Myxococcota bacterium]
MITFESLGLSEPILRAVKAEGYDTPTPIQAKGIAPVLEGKDVLGCAQTGTGKTAAFLLPMMHRLSKNPQGRRRPIRALVLSPTRELAAQIGESFERYAKFLPLQHTVIYGGVKQGSQVSALRKGVDVLVATPGRLLDLHGQGFIALEQCEFFVLDEADRMLDMGFIHDIRRLLKVLPKQKQNLLFSATMPKSIVQLASTFLHQPIEVSVSPQSSTVEAIEQQVMYVAQPDKKKLLAHILYELKCPTSIVFTRTKHGANRVVQYLEKGDIRAAAIHGNKSQNARLRALNQFKAGKISVLVATDIASRGIDIETVSHVFNFDIPHESESYVHRIGRTGRAGASGKAIAFCNEEETADLWAIERLIKQEIPQVLEHPWHHYPAFEKMIICRNEGIKKAQKKSQKGKKPNYRRRRRRNR